MVKAMGNGHPSTQDLSCVLHFGYHNKRIDYYLNGTKITEVFSAKDLGVMINDMCSPSDHIQEITRKANGVLSQLNRSIVCCNKDVVVNLFKVFVRLIIEAAGPAWNLYEKLKKCNAGLPEWFQVLVTWSMRTG